MPTDFSFFNRTMRKAFFFAVFACNMLIFVRPVYADPHAVFYTDRAQEQFFYNSLAALNQADFVEPGTGQYSRSNLVTQRAAATPSPNPQQGAVSFTPEQDPLINATKTDLPSILTRNITLEGNDLWTAYLVHQFALETATRRSTSELERIFCERGLGRVQCDTTARAQQQDGAFTTKPSSVTGQLKVGAIAALSSGKDEEKTITRSIEQGDTISGPNGFNNTSTNDPIFKIERPKDPALAALREKESNNETTSNLINTLTSTITNIGSRINPSMFSDITFDNTGVPKIAKDTSFDEYVSKLLQLTSLPSQLLSVRNRAEEAIKTSQVYKTTPNAVADYILESGTTDGSGSLLARITTPASTKLAAVDALAELTAQAATSQNYTNTRTIAQAGNRSLVDPRLPELGLGTSGATDGLPNTGNVAGISTLDQQLTQNYQQAYDAPQPVTLSPSVYDQGVLLEPGTFDALVAFTNDTHRRADDDNPLATSSAFSINIESILNSVTINDILCSVFPSIDACLARSSNV